MGRKAVSTTKAVSKKSVKFEAPEWTLEDLFNELNKKQNDPGLTTPELAKAVGHGEDWVLKKIHVLLRDNRIVLGYRDGFDVWNRPHTYRVWRVAKRNA